MKNHGLWLLLFTMTFALLMFPAAASVAAQHHGGGSQSSASPQHQPGDTQQHAGDTQHHEQALKVGKRGEMMLYTETRVGDMTLPAGRYVLQHQVEGSDHFVRFLRVGSLTGGVLSDSWEEVKCRLEPMDAKAKGTKIYKVTENGVVRVSRVIVGGENVAHVF